LGNVDVSIISRLVTEARRNRESCDCARLDEKPEGFGPATGRRRVV
jgi:hypothetical protein